MKQYYKKDGKVYQSMMATTKERIAQVKSSKKGYFVDNDKIYICYNRENYIIQNGFKYIFHLKRVPYGKKDTPIKDREYTIRELSGSAVGTVKEIQKYLEEIKMNNEETNLYYELVMEDRIMTLKGNSTKGKITNYSKKELKAEILNRMNSGLDISSEEYSNNDLVKDYDNLIKQKGKQNDN